MYTPEDIAEASSHLQDLARDAICIAGSEATGHLEYDEYTHRFYWTPSNEGFTKQDYEAALAGL